MFFKACSTCKRFYFENRFTMKCKDCREKTKSEGGISMYENEAIENNFPMTQINVNKSDNEE